MKKVLPALLAVVILIIIIISSIERPHDPKHNVIAGTDAMLSSKKASEKKLSECTVNFYMENSGSMDGYVNGVTEFKDVLGRMIVNANHFCKATDFYFINDEVYKANSNAIDFIQMLNPSKIKVGKVGSTDVNRIFRKILGQTKCDTVSILFSDCIYSVKDVNASLDNAKNATTAAFLEATKSNPDFATIILQFHSQFDGIYFDRMDHKLPCKSLRPYYVVMMGDKGYLSNLYREIKVEEMPMLLNSYFLSTESWTLNEDNVTAIISDYTNAKRIKPCRNYMDIEQISFDRDAKNLEFAVGFDADGLFATPSYLDDPENYEVMPNDYQVVEVVKPSSAAIGDFSKKPKIPFALRLKVPESSCVPMINVALKNKIPGWVKESNVVDDLNMIPLPTQSFAIEKMVEGIYNAYDIEGKDIAKFEINILKYKR